MVFILLNFRGYLHNSKLILVVFRQLSYQLSFPKETPNFALPYCIRLHLFLLFPEMRLFICLFSVIEIPAKNTSITIATVGNRKDCQYKTNPMTWSC